MRRLTHLNLEGWPLGPWEAVRWLVIDYFERLGPTKQGFLASDQVRQIKRGLKPSDMPLYVRVGDICESLAGDLGLVHYHIGGLRVLVLELERMLDQFCLAAAMTEELGPDLAKLGRRGDRVKAAIGHSLSRRAPMAIASGARTRRDAALDPASAPVGSEPFELARHADATFLAQWFRQTGALRAELWREILAHRELFELSESVLDIDSWSEILRSSMHGLLCAKGRFEAKATYLDCRLRRVVRSNIDPLRNPAARRLNEATERELGKEDLAVLRSFYPEKEFGLHKLDEDTNMSSLLDASGAPKDPDQFLELIAGRIEEKREEMIDTIEEVVAGVLSTDPVGEPILSLTLEIARCVTAVLAEWSIDYGYYATIDLTAIANWPKGGSIRDRARHWLAERAHTLRNLLSRDDPSLVARVLSKRDELRAAVGAEVPGPTTYDSFLRDCVMTDDGPTMGNILGGADHELRRRSLEGLWPYKP